MRLIGIDPGNEGAIAVLDDGRFVTVYDMPLMANGKKQQINPYALSSVLATANRIDVETAVVLEKVGAMPGQGVTSMFNFGMGYGAIQGVVAALGMQLRLVTPQAWKKRAGLLRREKDQARTLAQQLYPSAPLARKKDVGRADAILIARYGTTPGG